MEQWLRRSHERDDRPLVKRGGPLPDIDPIEELIRILGEANANSFSAGDIRGVRESSDQGRSLRVNDRHYFNSSGHVALPSCGTEPNHRGGNLPTSGSAK